MSSGPHKDGLKVGCGFDFASSGVVEGRIVNGADDLSRGLVAQAKVMGEVVFAEGGIIALEAAYALLPEVSVFAHEERRIGERLHLLAPLPPLLQSLLFVC